MTNSVQPSKQKFSPPTMLTAVERRQVLEEFNDRAGGYPKDAGLAELFEAQVEERGEAIALVYEEQEMSYGELDRRANQLAEQLRRLGVGPEVLVAVCVERSMEMVLGLLAIVKAGGAYVPLDPGYPQERLSLILADTGSRVLLTQSHLQERLPRAGAGMTVVLLDREQPKCEGESGEPVASSVGPESLAYVMYTSGSTGRPKGVEVTQRGVVRLVKGNDYISFSAAEVFLQLAPISFDAATLEVWGSLLNGARLVLMRAGQPTLEELGAVIRRRGVTTLWLTAGLFHLMVDEQLEQLSEVKQLLAGGDVLSVSHVRKYLAAIGGAGSGAEAGLEKRLVNGYGPTENTTFSCCEVLRADSEVGASVSIGRPIRNTRAYILDAEMGLVPVGVNGELYLGGAGLARGYLNRAELTAASFVPDPYGEQAGERLYRTGDVARYLGDGRIEFLGRRDGQVKIRGYRIEVGEVEAALGGHAGVREVAVLARADAAGEKRLVAYVVVAAGGAGQSEASLSNEWREYLKERLPEYLVPTQFVLLKELPLTPNGKLDRKALPAPEPLQDPEGATYLGPRTAVEELVAGIWSEVLGVARVGLKDNFFSLGGHSLLATRMVSRIRVGLGVELPLRSVFEWPTVAGLSQQVEAARQQNQGETATRRPELRRRAELERATGVEMSFAQQRLWFLDQLEPGSSAYNVPQVMRLFGVIDAENLRLAFEQIVARHESLRTTFTIMDGQPVQVVAPPNGFTLTVIDLAGLTGNEREAEAQRIVKEEAQRPFDLSKEPLLRALLLRLDTEEHVLLLTLHHIVSDGWSLGVLYAELGELYGAFCREEKPRLHELPVQYADYAAWQREWLSGQTLERQLAYWREQLSGMTPSLNLPTDHPRPAVQTLRGARQSFSIPTSLTKSLRDLSRREGVTLYMTLLSAFQTLLYRYSGQEDISVGTPIAGRTMAETDGLIGLFINTLVMRTDLSGAPTFRELLNRVRQVALGGYAHQDLPFERLVEELQPERDMSRPPLFQVMFILQDASARPLTLEGLILEPLRIENETARFDLTLAMAERADELLGELEFNADLFDAPTIERLLAHFTILLEGIAGDPDVAVSALPLLPDDESRRMLVEWNDTRDEYAACCIQELFEVQAARRPDAVAVEFRESAVSYAELNRRANQLARYLRGLGVGPEVLVGICIEKSIDMLVGLLGILKAGGAYVPLDPAFPAERLAFMSEDAELQVLLTESKLTKVVPTDPARRTVLLDADWKFIASEPGDQLINVGCGENTAYVIYTSGSTGKPKGVQISHRAVVNFLHSMRERPGIKEGDALLAVTTLSFDIAGLELYLPLVTGARVVIASRDEISDGVQLSEKINSSGANVMQATPATWRLLLAAGWQGKSDLRIFCGGETLARELANQLLDRCAELWNLYGPTETTIWSAVHRVESAEGIVSVGRPIANTRTYVLDENLRPVPIGVPGELFIGGDGLARGYLNLQELTAEKFVPDVFAIGAGQRLYRTGDLARYSPSGEIEILNRLDTQVKIRGFRIEPGEIEGALEQHPLIRQAVVVARDEAGGEKRLIGYVVAGPAPALTINELRRYLMGRLPEYMVPSAFVMLDEMPLTPNGKVNRRALPAPDSLRPEMEEAFAAPRTPVEELVAGIWGEVLGSERVGIHDNFFALGGHSLLATKVVSRVAEAFDIELPLRRLFEEPTVAGLAGMLTDEPGEQARIEKTAELLLRLARLSDEEVEAMLGERAAPAMVGGAR